MGDSENKEPDTLQVLAAGVGALPVRGVAVQYLTRKLNGNREVPKRALNQYSLFAS